MTFVCRSCGEGLTQREESAHVFQFTEHRTVRTGYDQWEKFTEDAAVCCSRVCLVKYLMGRDQP